MIFASSLLCQLPLDSCIADGNSAQRGAGLQGQLPRASVCWVPSNAGRLFLSKSPYLHIVFRDLGPWEVWAQKKMVLLFL